MIEDWQTALEDMDRKFREMRKRVDLEFDRSGDGTREPVAVLWINVIEELWAQAAAIGVTQRTIGATEWPSEPSVIERLVALEEDLHEHPTEGDSAGEDRLLAIEEALGLHGEVAQRQRAFLVDVFGARVQDIAERLTAVETMIAVMPERINEDLLNRAARAEGGESEARRVLDEFVALPIDPAVEERLRRLEAPIARIDPRHPEYMGAGGTSSDTADLARKALAGRPPGAVFEEPLSPEDMAVGKAKDWRFERLLTDRDEWRDAAHRAGAEVERLSAQVVALTAARDALADERNGLADTLRMQGDIIERNSVELRAMAESLSDGRASLTMLFGERHRWAASQEAAKQRDVALDAAKVGYRTLHLIETGESNISADGEAAGALLEMQAVLAVAGLTSRGWIEHE